MKDRMVRLLNQALNKWNEFDKSQKRKILIIAVLFVIFIVATVYITTKPKWTILVDNQAAADVGTIQSALTDSGYTNRLANNGTAIEVLQKDVYQAKISLAGQNLPSTAGFTYQDALDNSGIGVSETEKLANLKRVKESELAAALTSFKGVKSAKVFLEIPVDDNFFLESTKAATASAVLQLESPLDSNQAEVMARFLSRSVKNLTMENIEITDDSSKSLYSGLAKSMGDSYTNFDNEELQKNDLETKVRSTIAPLYSDVKVIMNLVFNRDKISENRVTFTSPIADSSTGLVSKEIKESSTVENGSGSGEPGVNSNANTSPSYNTQSESTSNASTDNSQVDYLQNKSEQIIQAGTGDMIKKDSSMSVIVYRYKDYDESYLKKSGRLDATTWEDYQAANSAPIPIDVDTNMIENLKIGTGIDNLSVIGYEVPVFHDAVVRPIDIQKIVIFVILAILMILLTYGLIKKTQEDEIIEIEPELSVEDLLVSTKLEDKRKAAVAEAEILNDIEFEKESEMKRQIEKFVTDNPESVAQLLRNWLNDEWE